MPNEPTTLLPPAVAAALDRGNLVEAIKLLRASNMDPAAIKNAVDRYMRKAKTQTAQPSRFQTESGIENASTPMPVREPSDIVRGLSPGEVPRTPSAVWWIVAIAVLAAITFFMTGCATASAPMVPTAELAPTGKLRAAINFGNPILANRNAAGEGYGVSIDLARELGRRAGVPVELVYFNSAGSVVEAVKNAQVDVAFVAIDPVRGADMLQTPAYVVIEGAYLVRNDSPLTRNEDVDKPGVRVAVGNGSAYDLFLTRELKNAKLVKAPTSPLVTDLFVAQNLEVAAGVKQQLEADARRVTGVRLLPGRFMVINQAMGLPRGRDAAASYVARFVEDMKASGFVASALARHRIEGAAVAPPAP